MLFVLLSPAVVLATYHIPSVGKVIHMGVAFDRTSWFARRPVLQSASAVEHTMFLASTILVLTSGLLTPTWACKTVAPFRGGITEIIIIIITTMASHIVALSWTRTGVIGGLSL